MRVWLFITGLTTLSLNSSGQFNLVLNPSFEKVNFCGGFGGSCANSTIISWGNPAGGTPDHLNNCDSAGGGGMPYNYAGYQYARTGISYAGIGMEPSAKDPYREYIEGRFSNPLDSGKKYCVSFYTSFADSVNYAISAMGAYIFASKICKPLGFDTFLPDTPQIENPLNELIEDSLGWEPISGEYTATGGEEYIIIGDFYSDALSHFTHVRTGGILWGWDLGKSTYYYIDDVSVREIITAHAGAFRDTSICAGDTVQLGQDTAIPGMRYQWQPITGLANPNAAQTIATPTITTTYTLTLVNDSMQGCQCPDSISRDSVTITIKPPPNISITPSQVLCAISPVMLTISGGSSYLWSTGGTTSSITVSPNSTTTYTCIAFLNGCSDTATTHIIVDIPKISACCDTTIISGGSAFIMATGSGSYIWQPDSGLSCDSCKDIIASPAATTTYYVIQTDTLGCKISDSVTVKVAKENCGTLFVPDAFSPNGDGQNDVFYVKAPCVTGFHLVIYDRWGNKVFETENVNEGWDGKYSGQPENAGTYVYYLQGIDSKGNSINKKGDVSLIR